MTEKTGLEEILAEAKVKAEEVIKTGASDMSPEELDELETLFLGALEGKTPDKE